MLFVSTIQFNDNNFRSKLYLSQFILGHLEIPNDKNGHPQSMEMVPLMSRTEAKDSVITLDYVSMYHIIKSPNQY